MEDGISGSWKEFLNRQIKIIYDDFGKFPKKKVGILISISETHLFLKINSHTEAINISKILRVEGGG